MEMCLIETGSQTALNFHIHTQHNYIFLHFICIYQYSEGRVNKCLKCLLSMIVNIRSCNGGSYIVSVAVVFTVRAIVNVQMEDT